MESASAGRVLVVELAVTGLAAIKLSVALSLGSFAATESLINLESVRGVGLMCGQPLELLVQSE